MKEASGIGANLKVLIKYLDTLITMHVTTEKLASVFPYKIEVLLVSLYFRANLLFRGVGCSTS